MEIFVQTRPLLSNGYGREIFIYLSKFPISCPKYSEPHPR